MSEKKVVTLSFKYGESVQEPGVIVMRFNDTGINLSNPDHREIMDGACTEIGAALYALAHDLKSEDITFEIVKKI